MGKRASFEGCTEWSCIYHGAYNEVASIDDPCDTPELEFIESIHEVQCIRCGTSYGLIERHRRAAQPIESKAACIACKDTGWVRIEDCDGEECDTDAEGNCWTTCENCEKGRSIS